MKMKKLLYYVIFPIAMIYVLIWILLGYITILFGGIVSYLYHGDRILKEEMQSAKESIGDLFQWYSTN